MLKIYFLSLAVIFSFSEARAQQEITEAYLLELAKKQSPSLERLKATLLQSQTTEALVNEQFAPELFGRASYAETKEKPIIEFLPVFSPIKQTQLGLRQKFGKGFNAEFSVTTDQRYANSEASGRYNNVTTTILGLTMQMDLWRDLLGRVTDTERENARIESKRARIEEEVKRRAFEITLRKTYWALVSVNEQLKIFDNLKVTATQQVSDARRRLQNSIGDAGEVARYEAQLAGRTGSILFLTYQKEALLKQLKTLLPELGMKDLVLGNYDLGATTEAVVACSQMIVGRSGIPYDFTQYDEMVGLLRDYRSNQRRINDRYSDVDVKLYGTVKSTGVSSNKLGDSDYRGNYGDSFGDMRPGWEAGVRFNLPLGGARSHTQKTKTLYDEKRLEAAIQETDAQVVSTHTQLAKSLALLKDVIAAQTATTEALNKRLKVIRQKYTQARVSVNDLIQDQDALLNSELTTVDAQLQTVNVLFDYLMIFTDTPCGFNRT